jgi:hypothetical protein
MIDQRKEIWINRLLDARRETNAGLSSARRGNGNVPLVGQLSPASATRKLFNREEGRRLTPRFLPDQAGAHLARESRSNSFWRARFVTEGFDHFARRTELSKVLQENLALAVARRLAGAPPPAAFAKAAGRGRQLMDHNILAAAQPPLLHVARKWADQGKLMVSVRRASRGSS